MKLFNEVEMPLIPVLLDMEINGMAVDMGILGKMAEQLGEQIKVLENKIYTQADGDSTSIRRSSWEKCFLINFISPTSARAKTGIPRKPPCWKN